MKSNCYQNISSAEGIDNDQKLNRTPTQISSSSEIQPELHEKYGPADFETAIEMAGFGKFNILLILCAFPAAAATIVETSVMSFILPSAECDLKLTLIDKGLLNGVTYLGMITSAIIWGYYSDTKGRKNLLIFGYFSNIISVMGAATSQTVIQLMVFKYISGCIMCGPFAILLSYLTELHGKKHRSRILMYVGVMFSVSNTVLPIVALLVLPKHWDFKLCGLQFHSWQVFIAINALPSLLAGILLNFFPESPKFLMSQGRNAEALRVFQGIYAINNRKSREDFPIKELINELSTSEKTYIPNVSVYAIEESIPKEQQTNAINKIPKNDEKPKVGLRQGWEQLRPLLRKPYLGLSLRVYLMNFAVLVGQNTLRLWVPQMFASIEEYEQMYGTAGATMCTIVEYSVNKTEILKTQIRDFEMDKCEVDITPASYTNNILVAVTGLLGYIIAGIVVNRVGSKRLLTFGAVSAGLCGIGLYFSVSSLSTSIIASISITLGSIAAMSILSSSVDMFPTSLRAMIVSLAMMVGRIGSILGNVLFPIFMSLGCLSPFIMLTVAMWSAAIISLFMPNTKKMVLK
ncbi:synaptic vesicle glycoprotein 2B isoform X2 [Eurosta solidaginis]|uniref:synaptic vesicle glycoprotein 2B isoform X2 n=1 Tax=Eurosta solidaginis TaxID=178769 RepID=UPI0035311B6F